MSYERLRDLHDAIDRALYGQSSAGFSPAHELIVSGWMLALREVLAELPSTQEGMHAGVVAELREMRATIKPDEGMYSVRAWTQRAVAKIDEAIDRIETLALGSLRDANALEVLALKIDAHADRGDPIPESVATQVERLLPALLGQDAIRNAVAAQKLAGPWMRYASDSWRRWWLHGVRATVEPVRAVSGASSTLMGHRWQVSGTGNPTGYVPVSLDETPLTALRRTDTALTEIGWLLTGGIPDEVLLDGATATATVDEDGYLVSDPGEEAEVERRPAREEDEPEDEEPEPEPEPDTDERSYAPEDVTLDLNASTTSALPTPEVSLESIVRILEELGSTVALPERPIIPVSPARRCPDCIGLGRFVSPWSRYGADMPCGACAGSGYVLAGEP